MATGAVRLRQYRGDIKRFLADASSESTVAESFILQDRESEERIVLASFLKQVDPIAHKGSRGPQRPAASTRS